MSAAGGARKESHPFITRTADAATDGGDSIVPDESSSTGFADTGPDFLSEFSLAD